MGTRTRIPAVTRPPRARPRFGHLTTMKVKDMAFIPAEDRKSKMVKYVHKVGDAIGAKFTTRTLYAVWKGDHWVVLEPHAKIPATAEPGTAVWRVK